MKKNPKDLKPVFSIHVSPNSHSVNSHSIESPTNQQSSHDHVNNREIAEILRHLLVSQERTNDLLEELSEQIGSSQRQRAAELGQWKQSNPLLARQCKAAADRLGQVQAEFLENMTAEINENYENMIDGEFMFNEFVDRFGPRMAHLNGVLQMLTQLSSVASPANSET